MLNYKKVLHKNPLYRLGRIFLTDFWFNKIFFRQVKVIGKQNIPKGKPVLIAPVHRNAMVDDMAVLTTRNDNPVFLARADIFKKKFLARVFIFFRMVPVFRIRDGKESLKSNDMTFDVGSYVLEKDQVLIVFPEAAHINKNQMLPLKKGAIRIVFLAAEKTNFQKDIYLIPTGLYYDNIYNYRHKALVIYGKPINILDYKDLYKENKQKAMLKVREDLNKALIDLSIHIEDDKYYEQINKSREIFDSLVAEKLQKKIKKIDEKFLVDKVIVDVLEKISKEKEEDFIPFAEKVDIYTKELDKHRLKDYLFEKPMKIINLLLFSILLILFFPLYIVSWINFIIPVCLPELIVKKFKDEIFHGSVRYGASLIFTFLWGLIGGVILAFILSWWIGLLFFLLQPVLFVFWLDYTRYLKKVLANWRFIFNRNKYNYLYDLRKELIDDFLTFYKN